MISNILSFFKRKKPHNFRRISADVHKINIKALERSAIVIVEKLQQANFLAYIVGGAVRDLIIGITPKDFDVATNATPEEVKKLFRRAFIIGRRFRIVHVHFGNQIIEVTTFRGNAQKNEMEINEHGRIISDNVFGSQLEDANRRDFTINAMYYNPTDNTVWDAHDGFADIKKRKLQIIGDIHERFREDPVRILRTLRFMAKLSFEIDTKTEKGILSLQKLIPSVPSARLADEFSKFLLNGYAHKGMAILKKWNLLDIFIIPPPQSQSTDYFSLIDIVLKKADIRYADNKKLSQPFIIAVMLWSNLVEKYNQLIAHAPHPTVALHSAIREVIAMQQQKVFMTRVSCHEMRDIWLLQQSLLFPRPRLIPRLIASPRLTIGIDFLEIRGAKFLESSHKKNELSSSPVNNYFNETAEECAYWANWWREYIKANNIHREEMFKKWDALVKQSFSHGDKKRKKRRVRKPKIVVQD